MPSNRVAGSLDRFFDRMDRYHADPGLAQREEARRQDRLDLIVRHEFDGLRLNPFQRAFIAQVLTETPPEADSFILSLDDEIIEAAGSPRYVERWGDPPTEFVEKMRALTTPQKVAIVEGFERGWLGTGDPEDEMPGV